MGKHKKEGVAKSSGIVVGGAKTGARSKVYVKVVGLLLACVVLAAAVVVGVLAVRHKTKPKTTTVSQADRQPDTSAKQTPVQQAVGQSLLGNDDKAQQQLDTQITQTSDKKAQASLYLQKASLWQEAGDNASALQAAQKAESLDSTAMSAQLVAENAEAVGNKSLALQYYQLQLKRMSKPLTPSAKATQQALQAKIDELKG